MEDNTKTFIEKWKEGIKNITPLQQLKANQKSNWVMVVGLVCGMVVVCFNLKTLWWAELILGASLFNQVMTMLGVKQKIDMLNKFEEESNAIN